MKNLTRFLLMAAAVWALQVPLAAASFAPQDPPPEPEPVPEVEEPEEEIIEEVIEEPVVVDQEPGDEEVAEEEVVEEVVEEEVEEEDPNAVDPNSPYLAIYGGDIHTVTDGVIRRGIVLCKNDRILKVGKKIRIPKGARRIDAHGMQVYPGLVGVDTSGIVKGRGTSLRDDFDPYALNLDLGLAGGLTIVQTGNAMAKLARGTLDGVLVGQTGWVNLGYSSTSPGGRRQLRESMRKVRDYMREVRSWETDKAMGEDVGEEPSSKGINGGHLALLQGKAMARFNANSLKDLLSVCDFLEEYPMQSVIFGGQEAWACAGRLGRVGAQMVITPRAKAWADQTLNAPSGWSIENAKILWEHGVPFSILPQERWITTGGLAGRDMLTLPMEAAFAIRGGLPQDAALRALTLDAAKILGVEDLVGSVEPGKDADLIICDGDLFHYRTFVQWSVVNGKMVYDKEAAPYFAHIRPRQVASFEEVMEEIERAITETDEEVGLTDVAEAPAIDAPEEVADSE
ncbi:MAG: amidohydrolase family protein [Planctomycetes bacterium]|nr:amidohydrolase family protein [Planctomycetota bacterium]MCP4771549.1 amidohydrolase family protein [Planctomycetota bacterium]MCP4861210.1 amidohydrolase family protein [Planctomycetota bacterium]